MKLKADENKLQGSFFSIGEGLKEDDTTKRIYELVSNYLIKIKTDESGWDTLFKDPSDNRYWELLYPDSEMLGGGPPLLQFISISDAKIKYNM